MKKLILVIVALLVLGMVSSVWADTQSFTAQASVKTPTAVRMAINYYRDRTVADGIIDFSSTDPLHPATPGKTSWVDSDDWTAPSGNVGFGILCIAPAGSHTLKISCGMLKYGTYSIPYGTGAGAEAIDYFGFSLKKDGTYIIGSPAGMQRYSETAATVDTWGALDLGHVYDLYNLLKIPATAPVGDYATTGTSPNQHLMIEFI